MKAMRKMLYNDWLNLNIHLFWCYDGKTGQDTPVTGKSASYTEYSNSGAWLIRKGWVKVEHNGQTFTAKPGQWLIVKPCQRVQTFAADTEMLSISFEARWPDGSLLFDEGLSQVLEAEEFPALERKAKPIAKAIKKIAPNTWDARTCDADLKSFLKMQSLLCNWLIELRDALAANNILYSGKFGIDERVMQAVRLINSRSLGEPLMIDELASSVGLSSIHLVRLFRQDLQQTPAVYFEKLRLEHALNRLKLPDSRIKEVSIELGFTYLPHFSKWFKKHTKQSPRAYMKAINDS